MVLLKMPPLWVTYLDLGPKYLGFKWTGPLDGLAGFSVEPSISGGLGLLPSCFGAASLKMYLPVITASVPPWG